MLFNELQSQLDELSSSFFSVKQSIYKGIQEELNSKQNQLEFRLLNNFTIIIEFDVENIPSQTFELKYIDTVGKLYDNVLKHITLYNYKVSHPDETFFETESIDNKGYVKSIIFKNPLKFFFLYETDFNNKIVFYMAGKYLEKNN